jgi:hypothetical protein
MLKVSKGEGSDWIGLGYGVGKRGGGGVSEGEGVRRGKGAEVLDICKSLSSVCMFSPPVSFQ